MTPRKSLLEIAGRSHAVGAHVIGAAFIGESLIAAALTDGAVMIGTPLASEPLRRVNVHREACLCMTVDLGGARILTGGADGRAISTDAAGRCTQLLEVPRGWAEVVAVNEAAGLRAIGTGKTAHLLDTRGASQARYEHETTVAALAFDQHGRHLAAAHYNGTSLWRTRFGGKQVARFLRWGGSHLSVLWSADGRWVVTGMQDKDLHVWRVADRGNLRMSGYVRKPLSLAWLPGGQWLATSGSDCILCWDFDGATGPQGRAPLELAAGLSAAVACVAPHPFHNVIAAGFEDGTTVLAQLDRTAVALVKPAGGGAITALAWSGDGRDLALGSSDGMLGCVRLSDWRAP